MKKSYSLVFVLAFMLLATLAAIAQAPGGQPPSVDQRLQRMTQMLDLTGEQQEKIKPILESENTQMQSLRDDTSLSQQDRITKMKQIRENTVSQIDPILTPDQQKKYAEMMSRMGRGHGQGGPGASTPAPSQPPQQ